MRPGEIYLARFPFGDVPGMKLRPLLLLTGSLGSVPEVLVAYISSVVPGQLLPSDLLIDPAKPEFQSTHLKVPFRPPCASTNMPRFMVRASRDISARWIPLNRSSLPPSCENGSNFRRAELGD